MYFILTSGVPSVNKIDLDLGPALTLAGPTGTSQVPAPKQFYTWLYIYKISSN